MKARKGCQHANWNKEREKPGKYQELKEELEKMWKVQKSEIQKKCVCIKAVKSIEDSSFRHFVPAMQRGGEGSVIDLCSPRTGIEGMECSLPPDGHQVSLSQLSQDSFRECQNSLTLTDLLIIIFSGISVSLVAILASFFLASTVHCFQLFKGSKGDDEDE
ncbi:hypothetical protein P4O66_006159 [Electrophorus voltai]|uniref:Uncharacterized protein n=1 Tax=Electrophorus voltai TaxID=2609070 RepID=A0AAD8ZK98_9TELE|nr:hypothetical protein P4O66_006159 [Electrophorus voltai]